MLLKKAKVTENTVVNYLAAWLTLTNFLAIWRCWERDAPPPPRPSHRHIPVSDSLTEFTHCSELYWAVSHAPVRSHCPIIAKIPYFNLFHFERKHAAMSRNKADKNIRLIQLYLMLLKQGKAIGKREDFKPHM